MVNFLSAEEVHRQHLRAYSSDRLPGIGLDRNALGEAGRRRVRDGLCSRCGEPILGRPGNASTCLVHRSYLGPPSRSELVALIKKYEAVIESLRVGLAAMDEEVDA